MRKQKRIVASMSTTLLLLSLYGCTPKISGLYEDLNQIIKLDFKPSGKVYARIIGLPIISDYQEKDGKIIFTSNQGETYVDIINEKTLSIDHPLSEYTGKIKLNKVE